MPRPSQSEKRREELMPVIAVTFAELGFRRTTTSELAARCGVRENILYRLWPDKKAIFLAAIEFVYRNSMDIWARLPSGADPGPSPARRILQYEAGHLGEFGLYRIIFGGLSESDDEEIRGALRRMYSKFQEFIQGHIANHRGAKGESTRPGAALSAWALVGLGTMSSIGRELGLLSEKQRKQLMEEAGGLLLEGKKR